MQFKQIISISSLILSCSVLAEQAEQKIIQRFDDLRIQENINPQRTPPVVFPSTSSTKSSVQDKTIALTKEELAKHPDLVVRALLPALMQGNADNLQLIYPIYQQIPLAYQDDLLHKWAQAILAKAERNYTQSIKLYRQLLAQQAEVSLARLQLAIVLFENYELDAALGQFQKLRAENLSPALIQLIDQYLTAIVQRDNWSLNGGFTYLNDPNINNAPKSGTTYGNWLAPERESAKGIGLNIAVGKKWSWGNGFFNELRLNGSGKYYWNNPKYNEAAVRSSFGIGFQTAKFNLTLLPFLEQNFYSGGSRQSNTLKRFSKTGGITLEGSYWLTGKWQLNSTYEYAEQRYISRKHLNGNYHFGSVGLLYLANAKQHWFANINYNRTATRDKDDSFFRRGITLGWGQEWGKGLSTRLSLSYAQKRYKAPMPIFLLTQRNREYGIQASVWHRAVHLWGITPRLTYNFTRTRSNHVFYSYDKHRVFLDFSKQF